LRSNLNGSGDVVCIAPQYSDNPLPRAEEERAWADSELYSDSWDFINRAQFFRDSWQR
jgi:hypothetical protein